MANFIKWVDRNSYSPSPSYVNNTHAAWLSWSSDKRNDWSRNPFLYQFVSNTTLNRFNVVTKWLHQAVNPAIGGTFGAGATCEFAPSRALEGNITNTSTNIMIVTSTAITSVGINMLANRGGSGDYGYKIRIIGKSEGKVEERMIVGNTGGTTPTFWLDNPLTFTPTTWDTYEILAWAVYMLGASTIASTSFRSFEVSANALTSLSTTNLPTISTDSALLALDEQYVPYNSTPWSGMVVGRFAYDSNITTRWALSASGATSTTIVWQVAQGNPTFTVASPTVVTLTSHNLQTGHPVFFTTTGALPTGIVANRPYYVKVIDTNTFNIYSDEGLVDIVSTSSAWSGTHSIFQGDSLVGANEYRNFQIRIVQDLTTPASVWQRRIITSHTAWATPVYTLWSNWTVTPSANAKFVIEYPNLMILRTSGGTTVYVYNYNKENITNGTNGINANAWSTTYFGTASGVASWWCMMMPSYGIQPDIARNARHSVIYHTRGWATSTIDTLDIAWAINGTWASTVVYDWAGQTMTTGTCGDYAPCDNEWRFFYINNYVTAQNQQMLRFDVKNRVMSPHTPTTWLQSGTAVVWNESLPMLS